jgi:hypothetical protein
MPARRGHGGDESDDEIMRLEDDAATAVLPDAFEGELEPSVGSLLEAVLGDGRPGDGLVEAGRFVVLARDRGIWAIRAALRRNGPRPAGRSRRVGERADASGERDSSRRAARQSKVQSRGREPWSQLDDSGCHGHGPSPFSSQRRYAAVVASSRNSPRSASSRAARRSTECSAGGPHGCAAAAFRSIDMVGE